MAEVLNWWRLEVSATGKVVDCRQVDGPGEDGAMVVYVQALDQKEAGRRAWNYYMKMCVRARRKRLIADGKCPWCAHENDSKPGRRCSECKIKHNGYNARRRAKERGEEVEPLNRADALATRARGEAETIRLEVLLEVRQAWFGQTGRGFGVWLAAELHKHGVSLSKGAA